MPEKYVTDPQRFGLESGKPAAVG